MPSFPKPKFAYKVDAPKEIDTLRKYRDSADINIPKSTKKNLLIATWNIANFGDQNRQKEHLQIIAEIISWFDIVAIQETKENSQHLQTVAALLGKTYQFIFSDEGGNNERMAFIYKPAKATVLQEVAELAIPPQDYKNIKLPGIKTKFQGFDRSPYMVSFKVKQFVFSLLNVHLFFGDDTAAESIDRRCLEAFCVARWANLRSQSKYAFTTNVISLGDFNLPKTDVDNRVYTALVSKGLQLPEHSTKVYSNINNDMAYDQIAFLPGMKSKIISSGVFSYDNVIFADMYDPKKKEQFKGYLKYYISDHRPMWMELEV